MKELYTIIEHQTSINSLSPCVTSPLGMQSMFKHGSTENTTLTADEHFDTWSCKLSKMVQVCGLPTLDTEA